jgi:additional sex combs-like protein
LAFFNLINLFLIFQVRSSIPANNVTPTINSAPVQQLQAQQQPNMIPNVTNVKPKKEGKGRGGRGGSSKPPPGAVNLERSFQICQAVIQNSPNRHRFQLKPPQAILAGQNSNSNSSTSSNSSGSNGSGSGSDREGPVIPTVAPAPKVMHPISIF